MPKTKEELELLKKQYQTLNEKLKELSEDELKMVIGGVNNYGQSNENSNVGGVCGTNSNGNLASGNWHTHNGIDIEDN